MNDDGVQGNEIGEEGPAVEGRGLPLLTEPTVRRVITGQRPNGEGTVTVDERVEAAVNLSGLSCWPLWGSDTVTHLPVDGKAGYAATLFPTTPEGYRVSQVEFPAKDSTPPSAKGGWPPFGLDSHSMRGPDERGMHWTKSVDVIIVLSGEIGLAHDDGTEVVLHAGDVVVQNGATHAWRPRGEPCRICFVNLGAEL